MPSGSDSCKPYIMIAVGTRKTERYWEYEIICDTQGRDKLQGELKTWVLDVEPDPESKKTSSN